MREWEVIYDVIMIAMGFPRSDIFLGGKGCDFYGGV